MGREGRSRQGCGRSPSACSCQGVQPTMRQCGPQRSRQLAPTVTSSPAPLPSSEVITPPRPSAHHLWEEVGLAHARLHHKHVHAAALHQNWRFKQLKCAGTQSSAQQNPSRMGHAPASSQKRPLGHNWQGPTCRRSASSFAAMRRNRLEVPYLREGEAAAACRMSGRVRQALARAVPTLAHSLHKPTAAHPTSKPTS